jgi:acetamidase/formamidase
VYSFVGWHHVDANDWGRFDLIAAPTYVELAKPGDALWPSIMRFDPKLCNGFC